MVSNTACVNATGGQNDCDTVETVVLPGSAGDNPPTVNITSPANGSTVSGNVTVTADASDDNSVAQVEFFVDGGSIGVDTNASDGWSADWDTTAAGNGSHSVSAVATDSIGQTANSNVGVSVNNSTGDVIYVSSSTDGTAGGVAFADEDLLSYNAGVWSMVFDGSDVGVTVDLNAFHFMTDGSILMSFDTAASIGSLGTVDDSDIVRFTPTSLGTNTAGSFAWYFDGSDVGLTTTAEDIDALDVLSDGRLVISTEGSFSVTGASGGDEDLVAFTPTSIGSSTSAGTWALHFDGSDVGLNTTNNEDVLAAWTDSASGAIYLSTLGTFSVTGVSGDGADIFLCAPGTLGSATTCTFSMYWDGSANGFAGEVVDGMSIQR